MLIKRESGFYYRKSIPERLRKTFGKREIWISLRTSNKFEAIGKGRYLDSYVCEMLENSMAENWDIQDYYKELTALVRENPADFRDRIISLRSKYIIGSPDKFVNDFVQSVSNRHDETLSKIKKLNHELDEAKQSGNSKKELLLLNMLRETIAKIPDKQEVQYKEPEKEHKVISVLFSEFSEIYLKEKLEKISRDTYNHYVAAFGLFNKYFSDKQLHEYTRKEASAFISLISKLPKIWGKSSLEKNMNIQEIIEYHKKKNADYISLSEDVINRHIKKIEDLWNEAVSRGFLEDKREYEIWKRHKITSVNEKTVTRRNFTKQELGILQNSVWSSRININTVRQIISIATFTGMRLEEICRLRPVDIVDIEGVKCFNICIHLDESGKEEWNPKTEAGERIIPIHNFLKREAGILERAKNCQKSGHKRIFFDLVPAEGKFGGNFSKRFSTFKQRAGLTPATTFHSFRHTFRTKLGDNPKNNLEHIMQIMGHEKEGMNARYDHGTHANNLYNIIKSVDFGEDWNPMLIKNR